MEARPGARRPPASPADILLRGPGPVPIPAPYRSEVLLGQTLLNKDAAFDERERDELGLRGLLPPRVVSIEEQVALELEHVRRKSDDLEQYIGLAALHDRNETLFYRVLAENLEEFLPVVYTPTVGRACQQYSHILRRARGLWVTPDDIDRVPELLRNAAHGDIRLIVVTDNERILGLGDQGAGGIGIPIGKLTLYTAAAGIHPALTLPVSLDVGTDRVELREDPVYMGWRHPRLRGPEYEAVVEAFVRAVQEVMPRAVLQWEDFKQHNAIRLLDRYRRRLTCFNDDIQGTAATVLGGLLAAERMTGEPFERQRVVLLGSGAAGIGIARLLHAEFRARGIPDDVAQRSVVLIDSHGLVVADRPGLDADKVPLALPPDAVEAFGLTDPAARADFASIVAGVRPAVLIGTSGHAGSFTEAAIREMAAHVQRPVVMPLSNPTANCEASPPDILEWTSGRAIVAAGSPFPPVEIGGESRLIGQANNVHVFPGIGLGAIVSEARELPDEAFLAAAHRLAELVPSADLGRGALYPPVSQLRGVTRELAITVVRELREAGLGRPIADNDISCAIDAEIWTPEYRPYVAV